MKALRWAALVWTAFFLIFCVAAPIFMVLARAGLSASFFSPSVLNLVRVTVLQAGVSALFSALIGLPLGLAVGRRGRLTEVVLAIPFAVPTVVAAVSWVLILGRSGYNLRAVILAHVFFNAPWIALVVSQARRLLPEERIESARTLGAMAMSRFWFIEWPAVKWSFFAGVSQTFSFCVMSFALILILGGGPPVETLETAVYSHIRFGVLDLSAASVCAMWELLITLLPWAAVLFFKSRASPEVRRLHERGMTDFKRPGLVTLIMALLFIAPYFVTLWVPGWQKITLPEWGDVILSAIIVSSKLAFSSASLVVVTALAAVLSLSFFRSRTRAVWAAVLSLSGGMSALVLGLGFWLAFGRFIDPFEGSWLAIIAIQTALFFNLAFRILWPLSQEPRSRLLDAAAVLGASPIRAFYEIEWQRWRSPILSSFALVAACSLGEVAAVSLFYSEKIIPLPLLIARWSAQYRFEEAQAVSAILFLFSMGTIVMLGEKK